MKDVERQELEGLAERFKEYANTCYTGLEKRVYSRCAKDIEALLSRSTPEEGVTFEAYIETELPDRIGQPVKLWLPLPEEVMKLGQRVSVTVRKVEGC